MVSHQTRKWAILSLYVVAFFILGTRYAAPAWLLDVQSALGQSALDYRFAGWCLYGGSFYIGMICGPFIKQCVGEVSFTMAAFSSMPLSYLMIWLAINNPHTPSVSVLDYFGSLGLGFATGGCTSLSLATLGPLFGKKNMATVIGFTQFVFSIGSILSTYLLGLLSLKVYFEVMLALAVCLPIIAVSTLLLKPQPPRPDADGKEKPGPPTTAVNLPPSYLDLLTRPATVPCLLLVGSMFGFGTSLVTNLGPLCAAFGQTSPVEANIVVQTAAMGGRLCIVVVSKFYSDYIQRQENGLLADVLPNPSIVFNAIGSLAFLGSGIYILIETRHRAPTSRDLLASLGIFGFFYGSLWSGLGPMTQFIDTNPTVAPKILAMLGFGAGSFSIVYNLVIPSLLYTDGDDDVTGNPGMFFGVAVLWVASAFFSIVFALTALLKKVEDFGPFYQPRVDNSMEIESPIHRESNRDVIPPRTSPACSGKDEEERFRKMSTREYEDLRGSSRLSSFG